jgi:dTDP-4-dehydrorhamnose 3,5-epimerase
MREEFYSSSNEDVVRGMHFQTPPHAHDKLVYCLAGSVDDVLLDLRTGATYGHVASVVLSAKSAEMVLMPRGIAHGFRSLENNSIMIYKTSSEHAPSSDKGIRWDSFGYDWQCTRPELSARDLSHPTLAEFETPFIAS